MKKRVPSGMASEDAVSCHSHAMAVLRCHLLQGLMRIPNAPKLVEWSDAKDQATTMRSASVSPALHR
eukprot:6335845-Pyramimonas_sp.AAC.1